MKIIPVSTKRKEELVDITNKVSQAIHELNIENGICLIYSPHTTSGITINENADPTVKQDILKGLNKLGLESVSYQHAEGNSPSHIKSSLIGCSEMIIIEKGKLQLGTWQGIFFCEFDGPRIRNVWVKPISG